MNFRQKYNRHNRWIHFRDKHAAVLQEIGIPSSLLQNEQRFRDFLTNGQDERANVNLQTLTNEQFHKLHHLAQQEFDYDCVNFTALEQRRSEAWTKIIL